LFDSKYLYLTSAILCLLYFIGFSKQGKTYKIFSFYLLGVLFIDFISSKLWKWFGIYNIFTSHFYDLFQFVILSYFYATLLKTKQQLYIVYSLIIVLPIFLLSRYVFNPKMFFEYSLLETYLATMPIIIYGTMHLYNNLNEKKEFHYANIGILLYLFCSTFIFLLFELKNVFKIKSFDNFLININIILQFIKFGFFFIQWKVIYFNKHELN